VSAAIPGTGHNVYLVFVLHISTPVGTSPAQDRLELFHYGVKVIELVKTSGEIRPSAICTSNMCLPPFA
jgi:hypothetical protein